MRSVRLARKLVRLYPRAWRARYEEEMLALLDARPITRRLVLDVACGCVREHLLRPIGHVSPQAVRILAWSLRIPSAYGLAVVTAWSGWFLANYLYGHGWIASPQSLSHLGLGVPAPQAFSFWKSGFCVLFMARPLIAFLATFGGAKRLLLRRFEFAAWMVVGVGAVMLDCLDPIFRAFNPWQVLREEPWTHFVPPLFTAIAFLMMASRSAVRKLVEIRDYRPQQLPEGFNVPPSILGLSQ